MKIIEMFAGAGMARLGFGANVECLLANDVDDVKCAIYRKNFGDAELIQRDICSLSANSVPERADLLWASSPCVDFSQAKHGAGIAGAKSGLIREVFRLTTELVFEGRAPRLVIIENALGLVTARQGKDLVTVVSELASIGYRVGALEVNAAAFVPQSRRRIFIIAVRDGVIIPKRLLASSAQEAWHSAALQKAVLRLSPEAQARWLWWRLPAPKQRLLTLADFLDADLLVAWDAPTATDRWLGMMDDNNQRKVADARNAHIPKVGALYQRTREGKQRMEVRFDGLAGCIRTAKGGASTQRLLFVDGAATRSRDLSPREAARLMGLPESFILPDRFGAAMQVIGEGVVVPVVGHLAQHIFEPIIAGTRPMRLVA